MLQKVRAYCEELKLIENGDNIVVGVSGGADSVCLFFLLLELQKEKELSIAVVHINHKIRVEAKEDEEFVKGLCEEHKIPVFLFEKDIISISKELSCSTEEAGRIVRYNAFEEVLENHFKGTGKIAVAHNKNDRAETILFHLFRGTGIKGLAGIGAKRDVIIRPILDISREQIEKYLIEKNIPYCIDATNEEDTYTRNKIRHHILPYANEEICAEATTHICQIGCLMEEAEDYLQMVTKEVWGKCVENEQGIKIRLSYFQKLHALIKKYVVKKCLDELTDGGKDITAGHVNEIIELENKQVQKKVMLPCNLVAVRDYEHICINEKGKKINNPLVLLKDQIEYTVFNYDHSKIIPQKTYTKWFDYDKIEKSVELRNRKQGDYLTINQVCSKKSLKSYFINEKIPCEVRDDILLLADGNHILWVVGYRISEYYKVDENTKKVLQVQLQGGINDD